MKKSTVKISMSLTVSLTEEKNITVQAAQVVTLNGDVQISRIADLPAERKVFAFVEGLGRIELESLSGDNYDNPNEWTNADVVSAVQAWITANS